MSPALPPAKTSSDLERRLVFLAIIIIAVVGSVAVLNQRRTPTHVSSSRSKIVTAVPNSFSDVVGTVTAVSPNRISISSAYLDNSGHRRDRTYQLNLSDATAVGWLHESTGQIEVRSLDVNIGDTVQAASDHDISDVSNFQPTKVYKLITS